MKNANRFFYQISNRFSNRFLISFHSTIWIDLDPVGIQVGGKPCAVPFEKNAGLQIQLHSPWPLLGIHNPLGGVLAGSW